MKPDTWKAQIYGFRDPNLVAYFFRLGLRRRKLAISRMTPERRERVMPDDERTQLACARLFLALRDQQPYDGQDSERLMSYLREGGWLSRQPEPPNMIS